MEKIEKKQQTSIAISKPLKDAIQAIAKQKKRSFSAQIEYDLEKIYLNQDQSMYKGNAPISLKGGIKE